MDGATASPGVVAAGRRARGGGRRCRQCRRRQAPDARRARGAPQPRQVHRRRVEARPRDLLRRPGRVRHHGGRVRVQGHAVRGLRRADGGRELGAVRQWRGLRRLLRGAVRGQPRRVQAARRGGGGGGAGGDGDEPVPAQRAVVGGQRRVVQPAAGALRPVHAGVPPDRGGEGRHRARLLPAGGVREAGRHPVRHRREQVLQHGDGHQRGRRRRRGGGVGEGEQARQVDGAEAQLGGSVADRGGPHLRVADVQGDDRRPPQGHVVARPPRGLEVRRHVPGVQELLMSSHHSPSSST